MIGYAVYLNGALFKVETTQHRAEAVVRRMREGDPTVDAQIAAGEAYCREDGITAVNHTD